VARRHTVMFMARAGHYVAFSTMAAGAAVATKAMWMARAGHYMAFSTMAAGAAVATKAM